MQKKTKKKTKKEIAAEEAYLDHKVYILDKLYDFKFYAYGGGKSNRQKLADYINSLPFGTKFTNVTIKRATGLNDIELANAKRHWLIHEALKLMEQVPGNPFLGWEKKL